MGRTAMVRADHHYGPRAFDEQQLAPRHQTLKRHEVPSWFM